MLHALYDKNRGHKRRTDMSQCHLNGSTSRNKSCINHHITRHVHCVLQIAFHLVENVFACTTQHDRACLWVLALHQECKIPACTQYIWQGDYVVTVYNCRGLYVVKSVSFGCTLCLKKMRHPLVTIISPNLNRFSKFLHCWKAYKIRYKIRYKTNMTLPTSP